MKDLEWHKTYLAIAELIANKHSKANRKKVGCVLVKDNQIISYGYNGTAPNMDNACEDENGLTREDVIHAEINAIAKCAAAGIAVKGASLYTTFSPCVKCSLLIIQSGISHVYYSTRHSDTRGLALLEQQNIYLTQI